MEALDQDPEGTGETNGSHRSQAQKRTGIGDQRNSAVGVVIAAARATVAAASSP